MGDDGWSLRADDGGFVRRANSVLALARGADPLDAKLGRVRAWYRARGLTPRLQLTPASEPRGLDDELLSRGWRLEVPVAVMVAAARTVAAAAPVGSEEVIVDEGPSDAWGGAYLATLPLGIQAEEGRARRRIAEAAPGAVFARLAAAGEVVAVGCAVQHGDWVGLFDIGTVRASRRRGHATRLVAALAAWSEARAPGARLYLQVALGNEPARALYGRLGFVDGYGYAYAVPGVGTGDG
jgi:N-acetylglutamate synthase